MKSLILNAEKEVDAVLPQVRSIRHHLHTHPELSMKEFKTSSFIRKHLEDLDISVLDPFLETDVIALLSGRNSGKNVTLRADMDALPLQENSGKSYCSTTDNVMHACGHDGHSAMLLGAAAVLAKLRDSFDGTVRFVFQPGEELVAGGKDLVDKGVLESPKPDAILALHAWPGFPVGTICSKAGPLMAAADVFTLTIKGKGGHGSSPEKSIDPILTASRVVNGLSLISSRKIRAQESVVVSICSIQGGTSANIIPDNVILKGSVRYISREMGETIPRLFEQAVQAECAYTGAGYDLEYTRPYIATINNGAIVSTGRAVSEDLFGKSNWIDLPEPVMGAEDFSYYIDRYPGAMFFLGMGEESASLHTSQFDFNDEALGKGVAFLVLTTLTLLSQG